VRLPDTQADAHTHYHFHPALLDACLQAVGAVLPTGDANLYVPLQIEGFCCNAQPNGAVWSFAQLIQGTPGLETLTFALHIFDADGGLIAHADKVVMKRVSAAALERVAGQADKIDELLYALTWQQQPLSAEASTIGPGHWLIFADSHGIGTALAERLIQHGDHCTLVVPGADYQQINATQWQISPQQSDHFQRLIADTANDKSLRGVVQLWSADDAGDASPIAAQARSLASTLHIAQALMHMHSL